MICKPCRAAADIVTVAREEDFSMTLLEDCGNVVAQEAIYNVAHLYHGICRGSTHCDCQHFVDSKGVTLNHGQA